MVGGDDQTQPTSDYGLITREANTALHITEQKSQKVDEALLTFLQQRHMLLILDNCEHVTVTTHVRFQLAHASGCLGGRKRANSSVR